jgi:hypothetical protein
MECFYFGTSGATDDIQTHGHMPCKFAEWTQHLEAELTNKSLRSSCKLAGSCRAPSLLEGRIRGGEVDVGGRRQGCI